MSNIKPYILLIVISITVLVSAETISKTNSAVAMSSLHGNIFYDGTINPIYATPTWTKFFVTGENSQSSVLPTGFNIVTAAAGGVYGYKLSSVDFNGNTNYFSGEVRSAVKSTKSGLGIDIRTKTGNRINLTVLSNAIVNSVTNDTLIKNIDNTKFANYRLFAQGSTAAIYKDSTQVGTVNTDRTDIIPDPGFELNAINAMWDGDSYATRTIETAAANIHTGKYSMVWNNGWNGRFIGKLKVQPNSKYRISFWAKLKISSNYNGLSKMSGGIWLSGVQVADLTVNNTTAFAQKTADFTTGPDCNEAQLIYHNGWSVSDQYAIYFDDFELTQLEGLPYMQFGKLAATNAADFTTSYIAYSPDAAIPTNLSSLKSMVLQAKNTVSTAVVGTDLNQYPQFAVDKFNSVISKTDLIISSKPDYLGIDTTYYFLNKAMTVFANSKITSTTVKLASIQAVVDKPSIKQHLNSQISITGKLTDNTVANMSIAQITYNILGNPLVSVNESGLITGLSVGKTKIETVVQLSDVILKDTIDIEVLEYKFTTINLTSFAPELEVNEATGTSLQLLMNDGLAPDAKFVEIKYTNLTPTIVDLNAFGTLIPKAAGDGKVTVSVTVLGVTLKDTVAVRCINLTSMNLSIPKSALIVSESGSYSLSALMSNNKALNLLNTNTLIVSDNRNIVQIDDRGNLLALKEGTAPIRLVINRNGKTLTQTVNVTVSKSTTGFKIADMTVNSFNYYPNPAKDNLTVDFLGNKFSTLKIIDLQGAEVLTLDVQNRKTQHILLENIKGCYFLQLVSENNNKITKKLIFQ
ncbi:MAG: T9SS type A sorting domain-containing protein [Paludibacter sp.]